MLIRYLLLFLLLAGSAAAQNGVQQQGQVTPGHIATWTTNGAIGDGGNAASPGITDSIGVLSSNQQSICAQNAPTTVAFSQLCLGVTGTAGYLTLQNYGGGAALPLNIVVNGTSYPFPGIGGPFLPLSGGVMVGASGGNQGTGTINATGYYLNGTSIGTGPFLPLAGGTVTGTVNFTGLFRIAGVTQNFPGSGNLVGTTDTQALTGKTYNGLTIATTTGGLTMPNGVTLTGPAQSGTAAALNGTAPFTAGQTFNLGYIAPASVYYAQSYGSCTWDSAHDVGPCVNSAIAASAAAGGGTVVLPAGNYGVATQIAIQTNGVSLAGAGVGNARDSSAPNVFTAVTELTWIGTAAATEFIVSPPSTISLYAINVTGIVFNCAALANICAEFEQVSNSTINIGVSEPRSIGALFTTEPSGFTDGPGNQNDDIWVQSRSTSATYSPTGILFDSGVNSTWNTSYNRIHQAFAWYATGDGIVFGNSDNNIITNITAQQDPTNKGGTPVVWANSAYTMENGVAVNGPTRDNLVLKTSVAGVVQGFQTGSTITAGSNIGTAAVTTVTLPTTSPTPANNGTLIFSGGTTGVLFGMVANCGGYYCGLAPNTPVFSTTGTTVTLADVNVGTVASSTNVIFSYGITNFAAPGTYVMTAVDATHWSLTTVPAGGHAQTDIAVANGAITFTDMVIPLSGTPVAGDTFTIVVPQFQAIDNTFENLDKGNASPDPMVEPGAATFFNDTNNPFFTLLSGLGNIFSVSRNCSQCSINIGGTANTVASTAYSGGDFAGAGNNVQGYGGVAVGGANNLQQGTYGHVHGFNNLQSGSYGSAGGYECNDRGHYAADCLASGAFAIQGDAQTEVMVLRGTGASASAFSLTADKLAAGAQNCINIPNNTAYAIVVTLMALDHTTVSKNETWLNWGGLLTRGANAASTALTMQSTPTPLSNGTVTGSAIAASADTTNGCLTLQFTPPTGNSDTWNAVARVTTVEVQ